MQRTRRNNNRNSRKNNNNRAIVLARPNNRDNALQLRLEYNGQQSTALIINAVPLLLQSTVGAGFSFSAPLQLVSANGVSGFAARFIGFTECRLVKVTATCRNFSSNNTGINNVWFTEDDANSPAASSALDAPALQYNFAAIDKPFTRTYTPHDPAQQTWNLVSGAQPVVGYFKAYTNITNFGCPNAATLLGSVEFQYHVQFRGLI